ncbi:MAG: hypothetical protein U0Z17_06790 [Bacteroidales bacterium]
MHSQNNLVFRRLQQAPEFQNRLSAVWDITRIITLNDGIRQEGQQWGDEHGIEIDEFAVKKLKY